MKTILFLVSVLFLTDSALPQTSLEVKVYNIKSAQGTIRVGLFTSEENFLKEAVEGKIVKASGSEVTVVFENLKSGKYALSVIHDENANGELDTNMMGLPKEGFGFGNNAMGMFGPPDFEETIVVIQDNGKSTQEIKLKYL